MRETTISNNKDAFKKWQIVPRMMGDVSKRSIEIELFGIKLPTPLLLAPVGVLSIAHPDAELAVARAAKDLQVPQIVSTVSSKTIEEIAAAHNEHPHWFQLYWGRNNDFTRSIISRAEKAGYSAIVVTLDTRLFAWRERDIQNAYLPFLQGDGLANYFSDPVFLAAVEDPAKNQMQTMMHFANCFSNPAPPGRTLPLSGILPGCLLSLKAFSIRTMQKKPLITVLMELLYQIMAAGKWMALLVRLIHWLLSMMRWEIRLPCYLIVEFGGEPMFLKQWL